MERTVPGSMVLWIYIRWKREGAFFVRQFGHELIYTTGLPLWARHNEIYP